MIDLTTFQKSAKLCFNDQSLLIRALTHPSYLNENPNRGLEDNERLEFLGDAILDFVSGEWLYHHFPEAPEGDLTRLRAALVRTETLAGFAASFRVNEALMVGKGEEENGGRNRAGNLCAAFEALIGALYLDQGIHSVCVFVYPLFQSAIEDILQFDLDKDPKSLLQEWCQAHLGITPSYEAIHSRGPDHAKEFTVAVIIGDKPYAQGIGPSKQAAAQMAAQKALDLLQSSSRP